MAELPIPSIAHCINVTELGRVSHICIDQINRFQLVNKKLPIEVKEFSAENCPNGSLAKVEKFHKNPYNLVACLPNPYKLSILCDI